MVLLYSILIFVLFVLGPQGPLPPTLITDREPNTVMVNKSSSRSPLCNDTHMAFKTFDKLMTKLLKCILTTYMFLMGNKKKFPPHTYLNSI